MRDALPLVVTVTEKFVVALLLSVTPGALQAAPVGEPAQVKANSPLKPVPGIACMEKIAGWPAVTEALVPPVEMKVAAAAAVPLIVADCGEPDALSARISAVVRTPAASGENTTPTLQEAFAAREEPQVVEVMEKSAVLTPLSSGAEVKVRIALPELVIVMDWVGLDSPCVVIPGKVKVPGVSVTSGAGGGGATAVPVSATLCGLPGALSVITRAAWVTPMLDGE